MIRRVVSAALLSALVAAGSGCGAGSQTKPGSAPAGEAPKAVGVGEKQGGGNQLPPPPPPSPPPP